LYETPVAEGADRDWRVDADTGAQYPFDLTVAEIQSMTFAQLPIKIEHTEKGFETGDEVGRVTDGCVDPITGYTACKFVLHDTVAGRTIRRLIENNSLDSLSLGHLYHAIDGRVEAQEVSVCFKGARSGTRLYKELADYEAFKSKTAAIMVEASLAIEPTAEPGTDAEPIADAADNSASLDLTQILEIATKNLDSGVADQLYLQVSNMASMVSASNQVQGQQRTAIAELTEKTSMMEKAQVDLVAENELAARNIVDTMNALLKEYAGSEVNTISNVGNEAAMHKNCANSIGVLASALNGRKMMSTVMNSSEMIRAKAVKEMKEALFPAAPAIWKPEQGAPAPPAPPIHATHAIQASSRGGAGDEPAAKRSRFFGLSQGQQNALSNMSEFASNGDTALLPGMLPTGFAGFKAPAYGL